MTEKKSGASLLTALVCALFPQRCAFCGRIIRAGLRVCPECEKSLPYIGNGTCRVCGRERRYCRCEKEKYAFERCVAPFYYEGVAKKGIMRFKFGGRREVAAVFAKYAAQRARSEYEGTSFSFVTAVPLSKTEKHRRGYDQAEDFGRALARELGLQYRCALCKPRDIKPQRTCTAPERRKNVIGAFYAYDVPKSAAVLLADDVVTTGATLSECALALKKAGAGTVCCVAAARVK